MPRNSGLRRNRSSCLPNSGCPGSRLPTVPTMMLSFAATSSTHWLSSSHGIPCGRLGSKRWIWVSMIGMSAARGAALATAAAAAAPRKVLRCTLGIVVRVVQARDHGGSSWIIDSRDSTGFGLPRFGGAIASTFFRLAEVLHQHQVGLALIDTGVEDGLAVGGHRIARAVTQLGVFHAEYDRALLGGEIVKGNHRGACATLELGVVDALLSRLHVGGPPHIVLRHEGFLFLATSGGNAPDAAARTEVDVLAVGRFDGLAGAILWREALRIAAGHRRLPDLTARLEVDRLAIVRIGRVGGIEQDARRFVPGRGVDGENFPPVIAGGVEEERRTVGRPAQAADARPLELRDLQPIGAVGIADEDFVAGALIADVGDFRAVGRPHGIDLAPRGSDERTLFDGVARAQRGAPDGRHRGTVRVSQAIASDGRIICLRARDGEIARAAAVGGHAPEAPVADAIGGVDQVPAVAHPGDAADGAIVEGQAAYGAAGGVANINIAALVLRVPHERDAAAAG